MIYSIIRKYVDKMEHFCTEGLFPILECFPSFKSAFTFLKVLGKKNTICRENHFTIHSIKDGLEIYMLDDQFHSINDKPAMVGYNKDKGIYFQSWFRNNLLHRKNGPAYITYKYNGTIDHTWYRNGVVHREDGPAHIKFHKNGQISNEIWCINGKRHRKLWPSFINYDENGKILSGKYDE